MGSYHVAQLNVGRVDEGKQRLTHLEADGPSEFAFTFQTVSFMPATGWRQGVGNSLTKGF